MRYYDCHIRLDVCMVCLHATAVSIYALLAIWRIVPQTRAIDCLMPAAVVSMACLLAVEILAGFVMTVLLQIKKPMCYSSTLVMVVNWIITGIGALCIVVLGVMACGYWVVDTRDRLRVDTERKELEQLFEVIYEPTYKVEHLVEKYKVALLTSPLSDRETAVLKDRFIAKYDKDQSNIPEENHENCVICFTNFNMKEDVIYYPLCGHQYHWICFERWLNEHLNCPMCKQPIRLCMIDAIRNRKTKTTKYGYMRLDDRDD